MANKKISDLTSLVNVSSSDLLPVVDVDVSETKKATISDIVSSLNGIIATVTGSTFSQLSGSLQRTSEGVSYLVGLGSVSIITGSNGQIFISGSGAGAGGSSGGGDPGAQYLTLVATASLSNERVFTPGTGFLATDGGAGGNYTVGINNNVVATISGSTFSRLSGSLQRTSAGLSYLVSSAGITITSGTNGQIIIAGAPESAQYLTLATNASLTAERTLVASTGLRATDGGANSNYTLTVNDGIVATLTGAIFTGVVRHSSTNIPVASDVYVFFSGSSGLTGSNANRRTTLFGGDIMLSGTVQQNRPASAPKTHFWQYTSQSVTTSSTVLTAFSFVIPSGSVSVDALVTATTANVSDAASFRKLSLFKNQVGAYSQIGTVGGTSAGETASAGASSWGIALDNSGNSVRLRLTGSATTITWGWNLFITEVSP